MSDETLTPEIHALGTRLRLLLPPLLSAQRSSWEQGVCAQAMLECHRFLSSASISPSSLALPYDFVQWLYALAHDALVRQGPDGRLGVLLNGDGASDTSALDPACIGETLCYLCAVESHTVALFPSPRGAASASLLDGIGKMLHYLMYVCPRAPAALPTAGSGADADAPPSADDFLLSHRTDATEIWSDSVYMLPPFLASAAACYALALTHPLAAAVPQPHAPRALLRVALQQVVLAAGVLQVPSGEWSHIYDLRARTLKRAAFWGVGNGWVCCGIVRVLSTLVSPTTLPRAPFVDLALLALEPAGSNELLPLLQRVYAILRRTLAACLAHALPSARFPDVLGDAHAFTETNLAQMLAYALFRLADLHAHSARFRALALPPAGPGEVAAWVARAEAMRAAAVGMTDKWGFVRDVCGSPTFEGPGTAAEGQAWAVMMEVARAQFLTHKREAVEAQAGESTAP